MHISSIENVYVMFMSYNVLLWIILGPLKMRWQNLSSLKRYVTYLNEVLIKFKHI